MWFFVIYGNNSQLLVRETGYQTEGEALADGGELAKKLAPRLGLILSVHPGRAGDWIQRLPKASTD